MRSGGQFLVGDLSANAIGQNFFYSAAEYACILLDIGILASKFGKRHCLYIRVTQHNLAFSCLIEALQQIQHGSFTAAAQSYNTGNAAGRNREAHILQRLLFTVGEGNILKSNFSSTCGCWVLISSRFGFLLSLLLRRFHDLHRPGNLALDGLQALPTLNQSDEPTGDCSREHKEGNPLANIDAAVLQQDHAEKNNDDLLNDRDHRTDTSRNAADLSGIHIRFEQILGCGLAIFQFLFLGAELLDQREVLHPLCKVTGKHTDALIDTCLGSVIPSAYHNHFDIAQRQRDQYGQHQQPVIFRNGRYCGTQIVQARQQ